MSNLPRLCAPAALLVVAPSLDPASRPDARLTSTAPAPAVAASPGVRFGEVRLSTGVRLHYAERGDARGAPVILLHGYSDSWYSYSRVLPLLGAGVHAYALDLRGHGGSERPAGGYAMRDLAADVVAFMDARGIARATVVGHSMGSLVAQQVALAAPGRVAGLVLVGSATQARRITGIADLKRAVDSLADPVPLAFTREFQASTVHRPVPPAFLARVSDDSRRLPARVWRALMDGMLAEPPAAGLRTFRAPALLLWGERDAYFPRSEQDALLALIPGATLTTYPETGHSPQWERPEAVARDLERFVARVRAAP